MAKYISAIQKNHSWDWVRQKQYVVKVIEIFPPALLAKEAWEDVVIFLQQLPIPPRRKKHAIIEWAKYVGVALTHEMVVEVLGELADRV